MAGNQALLEVRNVDKSTLDYKVEVAEKKLPKPSDPGLSAFLRRYIGLYAQENRIPINEINDQTWLDFYSSVKKERFPEGVDIYSNAGGKIIPKRYLKGFSLDRLEELREYVESKGLIQ